MIPLLIILFCLGIAFFAMKQIGSGSFSRDGSAWKQGAKKAKKNRPTDKTDSKE